MDDDIKRVLKDLNCKANSILCTFHCADPVVKTFLIQSFCLLLYGGILWKLNTSGINRLEVALNKILRKIWHLPPRSHSSIVHIVAQVNTVKNLLYYRFLTFLKNTLSSPSPLVRSVFHAIFLTVTIHGMVTLILNSIMIHSIIMLILLDTFALSMVHAPLLSHCKLSLLLLIIFHPSSCTCFGVYNNNNNNKA